MASCLGAPAFRVAQNHGVAIEIQRGEANELLNALAPGHQMEAEQGALRAL